jgi:tRNA 2-thiouridine synthesizing protein A
MRMSSALRPSHVQLILRSTNSNRIAFMADSPTVAATLDAIDLKCPLPVLKARRALEPLAQGAVLEVLTSDPGAGEDFAAFCQATGHLLIGQSDEAGTQRFLIQKAARQAS